MLQSWAEQLQRAPAPAELIERHVTDIAAAFFAGARTSEGQSLCALYGGRADPSERAAAATAIARLSECDDIHLASCITPGAVVIPIALALGAHSDAAQFHGAIAAGCSAGLRLGIAIGGAKALLGGVWPSLVAAPLMAAVTASSLARHDTTQIAHAMALALAGASGRPGRPSGAPSGRWFLFAEAALRGLRASEAAARGFRGDLTLLSKSWLTALAGHEDVDMAAFESAAPSISDAGFKPFPVARQGANAIAAFQILLSKGLDPNRIKALEVQVPAINAALLNRPVAEGDRLSRLSNIGFQLACAAFAPEMLYDAERNLRPNAPLLEFARCVAVIPASDLEAHLPGRWAARVVVNTDSEGFEETVIRAPFDHDSPGLAQVLEDKWRRLLPPLESGMDRAVLWQRIDACVSMARERGREPKPVKG
jgi:2-methylcitrate dehydratase PrpD